MFKFIIGIFGNIMNFIFEMLYSFGVKDVGLNIVLSTIIFTIIIYTLLLPFTISQQKFTRISAVMNPELQAIQKKYKNKKDQASMLKMQEETKLVYTKYGTSPMGGCLGSLIQLPFLFALFPVVRNFSKYIDRIDPKKVYKFMGIVLSGTESNPAATPSMLLKTGKPLFIVIAILIPVLAGATQFLSIKISQGIMNSRNNNTENETAQQMNTMMNIMPIMSVFFCFSMQIVLGLYWIVSAVVRTIQQIVINLVLDKKSVDDVVKGNMKKVEKQLSNKNNIRSKMLEELEKKDVKKIEQPKRKTVSDSNVNSYKSNAKAGSLASKANMVSDFNNRNK